jgi:hypothetical protein
MSTTWYLLPDTLAPGAGHCASIQDGGTAPTTANSTAGWTVAKTAASRYAPFKKGTKQASTSFGTTVLPAATIDDTNGNAFRTQKVYSGTFAATNWTFNFGMISTLASSQVDAIRVRVFASIDEGGGISLRELTSATLQTGNITGNTSTVQNASVTWSPGSLTLEGEYLFVSVAMETVTAGGSNSADWLFKVGTNCTITTPTFTTTTASNKAATLTDTFDSATLATHWAEANDASCSNTPGTTSGSLTVLQQTYNASAAGYARVMTTTPFDLTGSSVTVRLAQKPQGSISSGATAHIQLLPSSQVFDDGNVISFGWNSDGTSNGVLHAEYANNGTYTTIGTDATYDATNHQWLQISESGGTLTLSTAADNGSGSAGSWSTFATLTTSSLNFPVSNLYQGLVTGDAGATTGATATTALWDNFNILSTADNTTLAATESGSDTASLSASVLVQVTSFAPTESADTAAVTVAGPWWNASLAATESGSDTASGTLTGPWWNASLAVTEAADTAAMTGAVLVQGSLAVTEAADSAAITASGPYWNASLAATEGNDSAAASVSVLVQGSLAATESGPDTAAATAEGPYWNASLAATEDADTASLSAAVLVQGALAATEGADSASIQVSNFTNVSLAATEASDSASFSAGVLVSGDLTSSESGADTASLAASVLVQGSLGAVEGGFDSAAMSAAGPWWNASLAASESGADTAAIDCTGLQTINSTLAATENADSAAASVSVLVQGTLAASEGADTFAASVVLLDNASFAATEAPDVAAFAASVLVQGLLDVTEAPDTAQIAASVLVQASLAASEANDTFAASATGWIGASLAATEGADSASGTLSVLVTGSVGATEAPDAAAIAASVLVSGALATTEASDTAAAAATVYVTASLAASESGADTFGPVTAQVIVDGGMALTEAPDSASASVSVLVSGDLAGAEDPGLDRANISASVLVQGSAAATEDADTLVGDLHVLVASVVAAIEQLADGFAGVVEHGGLVDLVATEDPDSAQITGSVLVAGAMTASEAFDLLHLDLVVIRGIADALFTGSNF